MAETEAGKDEGAAAAGKRQVLRKRLLIAVAAIVILAGLAWGVERMLTAGRISTDNAYVGADVAQVTPLIAGPVRAVHVAETDSVRPGQLLVEIDDTDARNKLAQAEADLAAARSRYRQTHATGGALTAQVSARDADIERARAQLAAAGADLAKARTDLARRRSLTGTDAVSGQELTDAARAEANARANVAIARAGYDQAVAGRRAAEGELAANRAAAGPDPEANAEVIAARTRVEAAQLDIARTRVRAPIAGIVARKQVQVGQRVAAGNAIMTIVPVGKLYVDANFKEGQLGKVRAGQPVRLQSDLYGDGVVFHGRVIGFAGGTGAAFALIPAQNATGNWIKVVQRLPVRIGLDPAELRTHPLRVGLSMKAEVERPGRTLSVASGPPDEEDKPLAGSRLFLAGFVLALANFMVLLDMTIANVSVPHIAGGLGISPSQGIWVITSYSVAEAIAVPLTGWLAQRFGAVRTFVFGLAGFAGFSLLCGLSSSLTMLVMCRVGQGLSGGPLMPLTQTLLIRIFPKEKRAQAMGMWAMTTVVAPIVGPILGGWISDNWSWPWIFFINLPVAAIAIAAVWHLLRGSENKVDKVPIDRVGLGLLVLWVGSLQLMLDLGRERDWFGSSLICGLAAISAVGFLVFLAWELTEDHPAVDLKVLRHRGFSVAVVTLSFCFGAFFATIVIIPQWLQISLGYTATEAGYVTAFNGVFALIMSPIVARMVGKVDSRALVSFGIFWLAGVMLLRTHWTTGAGFWTFALPQLLQGFAMPFFFVPLTTLALGAVEPKETASAAGVMAFLRTIAAAFGASVATTMWDDQARVERVVLAGTLNQPEEAMARLQASGLSLEQARGVIERLVDQESLMLATNHIFLLGAVLLGIAAMVIWLVPKPKRPVEAGAAH